MRGRVGKTGITDDRVWKLYWTLVVFLLGTAAGRPDLSSSDRSSDETVSYDDEPPALDGSASDDSTYFDVSPNFDESTSYDDSPSSESSSSAASDQLLQSNDRLIWNPCNPNPVGTKPLPNERFSMLGSDNCGDPDTVFQDSPEFAEGPELAPQPDFSESQEFSGGSSEFPGVATESPEFPSGGEAFRTTRRPRPPTSGPTVTASKGITTTTTPGIPVDDSPEFPSNKGPSVSGSNPRQPMPGGWPAVLPSVGPEFRSTCAGYVISCNSRPVLNGGTASRCSIAEGFVDDDNYRNNNINNNNKNNNKGGILTSERFYRPPTSTSSMLMPNIIHFRCEDHRIECQQMTSWGVASIYPMISGSSAYMCSFFSNRSPSMVYNWQYGGGRRRGGGYY